MAAGIGNPLGYVPVFDGGDPQIIPGLTDANVSGGAFCFASGATDNVSSGLNSFVTADIIWKQDASGAQFNGVMIQDTGSNTYGGVATKGVIIALADGTVTAGQPVATRGGNAVFDFAGSFSQQNRPIGVALSSAGSETYALVQLGL